MTNKDALIGVKSRFLGDKIRNEEAINSRRNRIYSLFHFLPYRQANIHLVIYVLYRIRRFVFLFAC